MQGSETLFTALLQKCLEREKYILCEIVTRASTPPRHVALVAQKEELDSVSRIQISPPGFHVFYLPFADDIREVDRKIEAKRIIKNNIEPYLRSN